MNITKIAQLCGVSKTTVSRFLNNGYVSKENKEKIQKVIDETGYVPSSYAKQLRTKKTNLIGVIVPKISSETISRIVDGISSQVNKFGYNILLGNTDLNIEKEIEYLNIFKNNQVDGIIIVATEFTKKHLEIMENIKIPIVVVGQNIENYSCIYHDDYNVVKFLVSKLKEKNRKNIAYIGVYKNDKAVGYEREKGFIDGLLENDLNVDYDLIKAGDFSSESGYKKCREIFNLNKEIDSIICATDNIAMGAINFLKEINLKVPKDISILSIGDSKYSKIISPKLSTIHYYYKTSGIKAGEIIIDKINNKNDKTIKIKLGFEYIKRESI